MAENALKTAVIGNNLELFVKVLIESRCLCIPVALGLTERERIQQLYSRILYFIVEHRRVSFLDALFSHVAIVPNVKKDLRCIKLAIEHEDVDIIHRQLPFFPEIPVSGTPVRAGLAARGGISGNIDSFTTSELLSKLHVWDVDHHVMTNLSVDAIPRALCNFSTQNGHVVPVIDETMVELQGEHQQDVYVPGLNEQDMQESARRSKDVVQGEVLFNNLRIEAVNKIHEVNLCAADEYKEWLGCFDTKRAHHSLFFGCYTSPMPFSCITFDLENELDHQLSSTNSSIDVSKIPSLPPVATLTEQIYDQRAYHIKTPEVCAVRDTNRVLSSHSALRTQPHLSHSSSQSAHRIQIRPSSCTTLFNPNSKPFVYTKEQTLTLSSQNQAKLANFVSLYASSFISTVLKHHFFTRIQPEQFLTLENQHHVQQHQVRELARFRSMRKLVIKDQTLETPFLVTRRSSHHKAGNVGKDMIIDLCNTDPKLHWTASSSCPSDPPTSLDLTSDQDFSVYDSYDEESDLALIRVLCPESAPVVERKYSTVEKTGISRILSAERKEEGENHLFQNPNFSFTQLIKRDMSMEQLPQSGGKQPKLCLPVVRVKNTSIPIPLKHTLKPSDVCSVAQNLLQLAAAPHKVVGVQHHVWNSSHPSGLHAYYAPNRSFNCLSLSALFGEHSSTVPVNSHICQLPYSRLSIDLSPELHISPIEEPHFPPRQISFTQLAPPTSLGDALVSADWVQQLFTKFFDPPAAKRLCASLMSTASLAHHTVTVQLVRSTTRPDRLQHSQMVYTKSSSVALDQFANTGLQPPAPPTHSVQRIELLSFSRVLTYLVQAQLCSVLHLLLSLNTLYTISLAFIAKVGLLHTAFRPTDRSPLLHTMSALALAPGTGLGLYLQKTYSARVNAVTLARWLAPLMGASSANTVAKSLSEIAAQLGSQYKETKTGTLKWLLTAFLYDKAHSDKQVAQEGTIVKVSCPPL